MSSTRCPICGHGETGFFFAKGDRDLLICAACRHVFWAVMPDPGTLADFYGGRYNQTHGQDAIQQGLRKYYRSHIAELAQLVGRPIAELAIADIGCSYPVFLEEAASAGAPMALGVDWSEDARAHGAARGVPVLTPDAFLARTPDGALDILRYSHTLEHLIDPVATLRGQLAKLRPGGLVYITQPNIPVFRFAESSIDIHDSVWPNHLHFFSPLSLLMLAKAADLTVERFFTVTDPEIALERHGAQIDADYARARLETLADKGESIRGPLNNYPRFLGFDAAIYLRRGARPETLPKTKAPVFCVVDPNLKDVVGHSFEYDASAIRAAAAMGFRPLLLGNAAIEPGVAAAAGATPAFAEDIWGPVARRTPRGDVLGNWRFLMDLLRALRGQDLPPGSVIFVHTFTWRQILGLALLPMILRRPRYVYLLRYQPDFYRGRLARLAFRILERLRPGRVRLTSDSERLARGLEALTDLGVDVLPIPHAPPPAPASLGREPGVCHFVSLGNARDEKGIMEIFEAIRLLDARGELGGMRFTLQCNDAQPDVAAAIAAFREADISCCELLDESLDSAAYHDLLWRADVVLLPYWRSIYAARTSGVFMEALSAGKPVIATSDTWMSDQLRDHGAGLLCPDHDPAALALLMRDAANRLPELAARAGQGRADWLATHGAAELVAAVMGPARRPAAPPRRVAVLYPWGDLALGWGGAARRVGLLIDYLEPACESIRVLQPGDDPPGRRGRVRLESLGAENGFSRLARAALRIALLPFGAAGRRHRWLFWEYLALAANPRRRRRIRRLVEWADVVLVEYPFWARFAARMARRAGREIVVTAHDILSHQIDDSATLRRIAWRREESGLRAATHVVAVAPADQAFLRQRGVAASLAPNPTDPRLFGVAAIPVPRRIVTEFYGVTPPARRILLFVGSRHEPNIIAVERLRALALALAGRPGLEDIGIVVAGSCAPAERAGRFLALGPIEEPLLFALHAVALAAVLPLPFGTGASVKTIEAMAAGLPVIGSHAAFRGLAVTNGIEALIEDAPDRYPDLIAALAADPAGRARIGAAARGFARSYDFRVCYTPYRALLGLPEAMVEKEADPGDTRIWLANRAVEAGRPALARFLLDAGAPAATVEAAPESGTPAPDPPPGTAPPQLAVEPLTPAKPGIMALWERFHAGAYAEAADGARSLLAARPEDGGLHFLLGQSLHDGGLDSAGALAAYDAALRAGHDPFWVLAGRARLRKDMGRNDEAVRDYLRAAILRPLNPAAARLLARALLLTIRRPRARAG